MSTLSTLLADRGIKTAVVIDDALDAVPRATDLDEEAWSVFFDDLPPAESALLSKQYAGYDEATPDDLRVSDDFVGFLWRERAQLPVSAPKLFADYERTNSQERGFLESLVRSLTGLGLECTPMGRDPDMEKARAADIVFIDLFLGFTQTDSDVERAIDRVRSLVSGRESAPPLVVLMSRSSRLNEKRNEFRDQAGLIASAFRVLSKSDLGKEGVLERMLTRLASCYEDTKRLAQFIQAWNAGLDAARRKFVSVVSRVDLTDLAQIRELLLEYEGDKLGDYLLDVCDGVLRHEIESNTDTMAATGSLNKVDLDKYPAPHLVGTSDLQELVYRMTFQHRERVGLANDGDQQRIKFGDILRWRQSGGAALTQDVSLVITPACDLVRDAGRQVLLLSGSLLPLEPVRWSYQATPVRTPIVILPTGERFWIKWDLRQIKTMGQEELEKSLAEATGPQRIGRLREMYALELQQKFVADFGRVGQTANPPATFPIDVSFFFPDASGKAKKLEIAGTDSAVCYVGRDARSKPVHMLVLTEQGCDAVEQAIAALDDALAHASARPSLAALKRDQGFFALFRLEVPYESTGGKPFKGANDVTYGLVFRNRDIADGHDLAQTERRVALLVNVVDVAETKATPGADAA